MLAHFISKNNFVSLHCFLNRHESELLCSIWRTSGKSHEDQTVQFSPFGDYRLQQCEEEALDIWLRLYHLLFPPSVVLKERSVSSSLETEARLEVTTEPC